MNLLAAAGLLGFSSGRWVVSIAAWLAPVFLLRFVRNGRALPRIATAAAAVYAVGCLTWWGVVPVPPPGYFAIVLAILLPTVLPYVAGRFVPRGGGFVATLVFPCAWVVTEYAITRSSPYGSWGLVGYTQVDQLSLLQSAAVTGLWGIAFLIAWTAAVVNWAWELRFEPTSVGRGLWLWATTLALVFLLGGARLAFAPPAGPTVRVASFTLPPGPRLPRHDLLTRPRAGPALDSLRDELHAHQDSLFAEVRREAAAGARIVMWSEAGAFVLADERTAFERRAAQAAREARVELVTGVAVFTPGRGYYENMLFAFDSSGAPLAAYHKARPVPGDPERGADRDIPVFDGPASRIAGAVCFDADFPDLLARAGRERADLLLIPASDWRAIDPQHTRMALVRGVENGCAVVRQTNQGLSAAADHEGRILASADFFRTTPCVLVAQVPRRGARTWYPRFPQLLPLACGTALAILAAAGWTRRRRSA